MQRDGDGAEAAAGALFVVGVGEHDLLGRLARGVGGGLAAGEGDGGEAVAGGGVSVPFICGGLGVRRGVWMWMVWGNFG